MALNRRKFLLSLPVLASAGACSSAVQKTAREAAYVELVSTPALGKKAKVLVCMPETKQTREVWTALCDELAPEFGLVALKVEQASHTSNIERAIERHAPAAIVLMNNPTVQAYGTCQARARGKPFPPAVIVMTSFLDGHSSNLASATGISYEVPLITVVTNLRKLIATPIERVGVVRRDVLTGFVARQAELAQREQIRVIEEPISAHPNASELKRALRRLKQRSDVLWILNDDQLLSQQLIADGWLPGLNERRWIPTIVGAASLVSPAQSFGTFAVLPDHTALGVQAANLVFDLVATENSLPPGSQIELPLSTTTSVDLAQVRERFALRSGALQQVDKILE